MEAALADNRNITQDDVTNWMRSAPTEELISVVAPALDKIATSSSDYHRRFQQQMSPQARKLFEGQPVG